MTFIAGCSNHFPTPSSCLVAPCSVHRATLATNIPALLWSSVQTPAAPPPCYRWRSFAPREQRFRICLSSFLLVSMVHTAAASGSGGPSSDLPPPFLGRAGSAHEGRPHGLRGLRGGDGVGLRGLCAEPDMRTAKGLQRRPAELPWAASAARGPLATSAAHGCGGVGIAAGPPWRVVLGVAAGRRAPPPPVRHPAARRWRGRPAGGGKVVLRAGCSE